MTTKGPQRERVLKQRWYVKFSDYRENFHPDKLLVWRPRWCCLLLLCVETSFCKFGPDRCRAEAGGFPYSHFDTNVKNDHVSAGLTPFCWWVCPTNGVLLLDQLWESAFVLSLGLSCAHHKKKHRHITWRKDKRWRENKRWRRGVVFLNDLLLIKQKTLLVPGAVGKKQSSFYWQRVRLSLIHRKERSRKERKSLTGTKQHLPK